MLNIQMRLEMQKIELHLYLKNNQDHLHNLRIVDENKNNFTVKIVQKDDIEGYEVFYPQNEENYYDFWCCGIDTQDFVELGKNLIEQNPDLNKFVVYMADNCANNQNIYALIESDPNFDWDFTDEAMSGYPYAANSIPTEYGRELVIDFVL